MLCVHDSRNKTHMTRERNEIENKVPDWSNLHVRIVGVVCLIDVVW